MITVAVLTYNHERYIEPCIASVLNQEAPYELIVYDDCSTDGTAEVIERYDGSISRVIRPEANAGNVVGWNALIDAAGGDHIVFLSGDDELSRDALPLLYECISTRGGDWIYGDLTVIGAGDETLDEWNYAHVPQSARSIVEAMRIHLRKGTPFGLNIPFMACFRLDWIRKNDLRAVSFESTPAFADTSTAIEWLKREPEIRRIPHPLFRYRRHFDGETFTAAEDRQAMNDEARVLLGV